MVKKKAFYVGPKFYSVQPEKVHRTRHIMRPSGLLAGRRIVPKAQSDGLRVIRLKQDIRGRDTNMDGKINKKDIMLKGQIIGRTSKVRPSRVEIVRHYRKSRKGRTPVRSHARRR